MPDSAFQSVLSSAWRFDSAFQFDVAETGTHAWNVPLGFRVALTIGRGLMVSSMSTRRICELHRALKHWAVDGMRTRPRWVRRLLIKRVKPFRYYGHIRIGYRHAG